MKYKRIFSIVLALSLILGSILPQFGTINYAEGIDEEEITEEQALEEINAYFTENYNYSNAPGKLQEHFLAIESLNIEGYNTLTSLNKEAKTERQQYATI